MVLPKVEEDVPAVLLLISLPSASRNAMDLIALDGPSRSIVKFVLDWFAVPGKLYPLTVMGNGPTFILVRFAEATLLGSTVLAATFFSSTVFSAAEQLKTRVPLRVILLAPEVGRAGPLTSIRQE